jgi:hypothetical protein
MAGMGRHQVLYKGGLCQVCNRGRGVYPACAEALNEVLAMARSTLEATASLEERQWAPP